MKTLKTEAINEKIYDIMNIIASVGVGVSVRKKGNVYEFKCKPQLPLEEGKKAIELIQKKYPNVNIQLTGGNVKLQELRNHIRIELRNLMFKGKS